jgi:hypothetical protein
MRWNSCGNPRRDSGLPIASAPRRVDTNARITKEESMKMFGFKASAFAFAAALALFAPVSAALAEDTACCLKSGDCIDTDDKTCGDRGGTFDDKLTCKEVDCNGKGKGADCSPGYYKNHLEEWCSTFRGEGTPEKGDSFPGSDLSRNCASGSQCATLLMQLKTKGPGSSFIRSAAKDFLDSCFETAEASPCEDDD